MPVTRPANAIMAGTVAHFAASTAPTGWIKANGAAVSRTTYAALFEAISITYGEGDGSTTFNVPDLRGEFMRGFDDGRGVDSGRGIGTWQTGQNESHAHGYNGYPPLANMYPTNVNQAFSPQSGYGSAAQPVTIANSGGNEARPRNFALLACIKY